MSESEKERIISKVAPLAGAWIEICKENLQIRTMMTSLPSRERGLKSTPAPTCAAIYLSLPSRERGLKFFRRIHNLPYQKVAPLAGAWIEIYAALNVDPLPQHVAPLAGAWIEICFAAASSFGYILSLPSRERGLKFPAIRKNLHKIRRSPRGSVD